MMRNLMIPVSRGQDPCHPAPSRPSVWAQMEKWGQNWVCLLRVHPLLGEGGAEADLALPFGVGEGCDRKCVSPVILFFHHRGSHCLLKSELT